MKLRVSKRASLTDQRPEAVRLTQGSLDEQRQANGRQMQLSFEFERCSIKSTHMPRHYYDDDGNYRGYSLSDAEQDRLKQIEIREYQERHKNDAQDQAAFNRGCLIFVAVAVLVGGSALLIAEINERAKRQRTPISQSTQIVLAFNEKIIWTNPDDFVDGSVGFSTPDCCGVWTWQYVKGSPQPIKRGSAERIERRLTKIEFQNPWDRDLPLTISGNAAVACNLNFQRLRVAQRTLPPHQFTPLLLQQQAIHISLRRAKRAPDGHAVKP